MTAATELSAGTPGWGQPRLSNVWALTGDACKKTGAPGAVRLRDECIL